MNCILTAFSKYHSLKKVNSLSTYTNHAILAHKYMVTGRHCTCVGDTSMRQ